VDLPLVDVPGGRVEYDDVPGDPALAPLLLLHEGLGSVRLWRRFHHRLAAATGRRAVAFSRLGHGGSDLPTGKRTPRYMHDEAAEVVPALRAALGLDRVVLVGHSDGGSIALLHAGTADVDGLVVIAPHVFVEEAGLRGIEQARRDYVEGDLRARMARYHRDPDVTFWRPSGTGTSARSWPASPARCWACRARRTRTARSCTWRPCATAPPGR
jgi:pimeloyl-ACP methyl ester carboxylesterase